MENTYPTSTHHRTITIAAIVGTVISVIFLYMHYQQGKIFAALAGQEILHTGSKLQQELVRIEQSIQADKFIQQHEYEKALKTISGTTSQDYYNRGTIQTILAYQYALQSSISGLENAQFYIHQAEQNLDIAKKISDTSFLDNAIDKNQITLHALSPVISIKTCYGIGNAIIQELYTVSETIETIQSTLSQEKQVIAAKSHLISSECMQTLNNIANESQIQVNSVNATIKKKTLEYSYDFAERLDDPMLCIQNPYKNILMTIIKGQQGLKSYEQLHQNTIDALQQEDKELISQLCNQTKNDAQINQQIENAVQDLLSELYDEQKQENTPQGSSQTPQYKEFFEENEQQTLKDIQKINQGRIENVLNIRGKGNYEPQRYINDMFNQFYGNSGDFINLHK